MSDPFTEPPWSDYPIPLEYTPLPVPFGPVPVAGQPGAFYPSIAAEVINDGDAEEPWLLDDGHVRTLVPVTDAVVTPGAPLPEMLADIDEAHERFAAARAILTSRGL